MTGAGYTAKMLREGGRTIMLRDGAALLRRHWFDILRALLHASALAGLTGTLALTWVAEPYFNRGVVAPADYTTLPWTDVNPLAINTFLNEEPDPVVVERSIDMIADARFGYIRQIFGWYEIEPSPGVFVDARGRSTWEKYDRIVDLASARGLQIIARLEKPPAWARVGQPDPSIDGPPDRLGDYASFVSQVVSRYRGKITFVQIWNEPNLAGEWGGKPIDPRGYVDLLEAGARAARDANPDVVILLAGLAPTDQTGPDNLSDLLFLERVYQYGGAPFFDIAAVMIYGYGYSPYDRRVEPDRNNYSRPIQTREIMVRNGDAETPVWAVEYGWVSLPDAWEGDPSPWGKPVSRERQAQYLVNGYARAQREWPWLGVMAVWAFRFPHPADAPDQADNPTRGFAIVEHDFTPYPAFTALAEAAPYIQRLHPGAYALSADDRARLARGEPLQLRIAGDGLRFIVSGRGQLDVTLDRRRSTHAYDDSGTRSTEVARGLAEVRHDVTIEARGVTVEEIVVTRIWVHAWIYPWLRAVILLLLLANIASAVWMLRELGARMAAVRRIVPTIASDVIESPTGDPAATIAPATGGESPA